MVALFLKEGIINYYFGIEWVSIIWTKRYGILDQWKTFKRFGKPSKSSTRLTKRARRGLKSLWKKGTTSNLNASRLRLGWFLALTWSVWIGCMTGETKFSSSRNQTNSTWLVKKRPTKNSQSTYSKRRQLIASVKTSLYSTKILCSKFKNSKRPDGRLLWTIRSKWETL